MIIYTFAQLVIFVASLVAAIEISRAYLALIHLHWQTRVFAKTFFVCCAIFHLGLALDSTHGWFIDTIGLVQAVSIVMFLVLLALDLNTALRNLRRAFKLIQAEYESDGDRMIAAVTMALRQGR